MLNKKDTKETIIFLFFSMSGNRISLVLDSRLVGGSVCWIDPQQVCSPEAEPHKFPLWPLH